MEQFIGCDAHKKFSVFVAVNEKGQAGEALRVAHDRQLYREFLARLPAHSAIAVEASGSYSWLVDEMERSGHHPRLCNPLEAKRRMGLTNKTDKLDARGLAILLRNGTLPEVWIPPAEVRDQRELLRLRIFLVRLRTRVKNRIHGTLARHNVQVPGADLFGLAARSGVPHHITLSIQRRRGDFRRKNFRERAKGRSERPHLRRIAPLRSHRWRCKRAHVRREHHAGRRQG